MSKPKVTICPPGPQEVFFQEHQFDRDLDGSNPEFYGESIPEPVLGNNVGLEKNKKKRLKQAEQALDGHENKDAILKILRRRNG